MMRSAFQLQIRRLVTPAVDLRHDVVDVSGGAPAGSHVNGGLPLARRMLEQAPLIHRGPAREPDDSEPIDMPGVAALRFRQR